MFEKGTCLTHKCKHQECVKFHKFFLKCAKCKKMLNLEKSFACKTLHIVTIHKIWFREISETTICKYVRYFMKNGLKLQNYAKLYYYTKGCRTLHTFITNFMHTCHGTICKPHQI